MRACPISVECLFSMTLLSCPFTLMVSHAPISVEGLFSMTLLPGGDEDQRA